MNAKVWSALVIFLVAIIAATVLWVAPPSGAKGTAVAVRESAMAQLGERIASLHPQGNVLVIANPLLKRAGLLDERSQFERAALRGLRRGLGRNTRVTMGLPDIRPEYFTSPQSIAFPPDCRTPLSFLIQPDSIDRLAQANPDCEVIVSLIGLPAAVEKLRVWEPQNTRRFALLLPDLRLLGPPAEVLAAFARGKLLALLLEECGTGEPLVVTGENVGELIERRPKLFGY